MSSFPELGGDVVIEELLEGPRSRSSRSATARSCLALPVAQDFKRAEDGDVGPNTGGMGSFAPVPGFDAVAIEKLVDLTCRPILAELAERDHPFIGALFAGLMLTPDGPRVLEYNCRFGDPETQSLMPLIEGDLLDVLAACCRRRPGRGAAGAESRRGGDRGSCRRGLPGARRHAALRSAGSKRRRLPVRSSSTPERPCATDAVVTNGGRILNVTGVGDDIAAARAAAYAAADLIAWDGVRRREDIALAAASLATG